MSGSWLAGCATSARPPATAGDVSSGQPIETSTTIVTPTDSFSAQELLARARVALSEARFAEATRDFQLVVENAARAEERLEGLFGWATALDLSGQPGAALRVYSRFAAETRDSRDRERAQVRMVRLLVYLERYDEAHALALLIDPGSRSALERVALGSALALGAVERGDLDAAENAIVRARQILEREGFDRALVPPLDAAAVYFALGELRRKKAEQIQFDTPTAGFPQALEARCQLVLDAQSAYSQTMRSNDAHWSAMAGVRVGELYQHLHRDLVHMPTPSAARTPHQKQLFEGAIRLRYSILLHKSVAMMRATVALLERSAQKSPWRARAEESLAEIERAHQKEEAAIDALPYSREQLQQVLDEMAQRAARATP